jgi:methylglutaconyl-CoA hydratase
VSDEGTPLVRLQVTAGVATVTLDSPGNRNALSSALLTQLEERLRTAIAHDAARVVVLTGTGPAFCAGADLKELRSGAPQATTASLGTVIRLVHESPSPVVARLNGPARAGGVGLMAACDVVVAPAAVTFSFTEVRIGVAPAIIAVPVLRRLPQAAALRMFLTGEVVDAARARELGLVDVVADDAGEGLDAAVADVTDALLRGAPGALATTKRLVREVPGMSVADGLAAMTELSARTFAGDEAAEGMAAFVERRHPAWVPPPSSEETGWAGGQPTREELE